MTIYLDVAKFTLHVCVGITKKKILYSEAAYCI